MTPFDSLRVAHGRSTLKGAINVMIVRPFECALAYLPLLATSFRGWCKGYHPRQERRLSRRSCRGWDFFGQPNRGFRYATLRSTPG